jgi:hypothetical protein
MTEKLHTIAEIIAGARQAAMNPRGPRRHLTCAACGQLYDRTHPMQVTHHLSAAHPKWAP